MKKNRYLYLISILLSLLLFSTAYASTAFHHPLFSSLKQEHENIRNTTPSPTIVVQPTILLPRSTVPTFATPGGNFTVTFTTNQFTTLYASLSTAYEPVVDEINLSIETIAHFPDNWQVTVLVPLDIPEELYNLTLIIENNGIFSSYTEPRAVSIIHEFSENFSFIHLADFHVGDFRGLTENVRQTIGYKSLKKCIDEINLIHPDFVLISGDLVFGSLYPLEYAREYRECYDLLQRFDVPTFLCPGNHDGYYKPGQDGFDYWKTYFGPLYYSFNYGNNHFISVNSYDWPSYSRRTMFFAPLNWGGSIQEEQLQWIEQDLNTSTAEHTFMFLHHNPLWDTTNDSLLKREYQNRNELNNLIQHYNVSMVLAGHVHWDNVTKVNNTMYLTTTTPSSDTRAEDGYWGYRLVELKDDDIVSYNYKEPKYSIPSYHLNITSENLYTKIVKNDLEINLTVLVKFIVPLGNYTVNTGNIALSRQNDDQMEVYIKTLIGIESTVTITLSLSP